MSDALRLATPERHTAQCGIGAGCLKEAVAQSKGQSGRLHIVPISHLLVTELHYMKLCWPVLHSVPTQTKFGCFRVLACDCLIAPDMACVRACGGNNAHLYDCTASAAFMPAADWRSESQGTSHDKLHGALPSLRASTRPQRLIS